MAMVEPARPGSFETPNLESALSAVSWGAIVGGAVAAASASLILVLLGTALGFASVSPWQNAGASAAAVGAGAVIWLVITQWLSAAFGGYLTGRLRTKWAAHNSDEVFFRDTAHGFLSWALSTAIVVWLLMSAVGGGANMAATVTSGVAQGAGQTAGEMSDPMAYFNDSLFRAAVPSAGSPTDATTGTAAPATDTAATGTEAGVPAAPATTGTDTAAPAPAASPPPSVAALPTGTASSAAETESNAEVNAESMRILGRAVGGEIAADDRTYLAQLVSRRTGLSQADAEARVDQVVAAAKQTAETAREAATAVAFATALSLLIGAFVAAVGGAIGGRHRDLL